MLASVALAARAEALNGLRHGAAMAGGFVPQQACLPSGNHRDSEARA